MSQSKKRSRDKKQGGRTGERLKDGIGKGDVIPAKRRVRRNVEQTVPVIDSTGSARRGGTFTPKDQKETHRNRSGRGNGCVPINERLWGEGRGISART